MKLLESSVSNIEDLFSPEFLREEDKRIMSLLTATYVSHMFPELTVREVFTELEDVEFVKQVIRDVLREINDRES